MKTLIEKWGSSLALRIPKMVAREASLGAGDKVDLRLSNGHIVIEPTRSVGYSLDELLAAVTETNRHGEISTGLPQGREVW